MDSTPSGQAKVGTPKKPQTSRSSLSRSTKTGTSSPSPKVATDSPRPAASKNADPPCKPAAAKATAGLKEDAVTKSSTARTMAASPNKSRTVPQRDTASSVKAPSNATTSRHQNGDKGAQQTPSPLITKTAAGKKCAEGIQTSKPKATQEGGIAMPTKRNGASKREVGRLPEHGLVPKDKSPSLRPERNASAPSKPPAAVSNLAKPLKAPLMSNQPTEIVSAPDKPVPTTSLPAKGVKSPAKSSRPTSASSTTTSLAKTLSPLVKSSRATPTVPKAIKTPTSSDKPVKLLSSSAKAVKTPPAKPVSATNTPNHVKQGKQAPATKQASVPIKPTTTKLVKTTPGTGKPVSEKCAAPKGVMNVESSISSVDPLQTINKKNASNGAFNANEKLSESANPVEQQINATCGPINLPEELANTLAVLVNKTTEHTLVDYVDTNGKLLENPKLPITPIKSTVATGELLVEPHLVGPSGQLSIPLEQGVISSIKSVNHTAEENKWETVSPPSKKQVIISVEKEKIPMKKEQLRSPLELEKPSVESSKPLEEEVKTPVEPSQKEQSSPLDSEKSSTEPDKPSLEVVKAPVEHLHEEMFSLDLANSSAVIDKPSVEVVRVTVEPLPDDMSSLESKVESANELNEESQILFKPMDEDVTLSMELIKPLGEMQISSDESAMNVNKDFKTQEVLAKPSKETVDVVKKEMNHLKEEIYSCSPLTERKRKPLDEGVKSPTECVEPSEEVLSSSLEQVTPLEEEVYLLEEGVISIEQPVTLLTEGVPLKHLGKAVNSSAGISKPQEALVAPTEEETTTDESVTFPKESVKPIEELTSTLERSQYLLEPSKPLELVVLSPMKVAKTTAQNNEAVSCRLENATCLEESHSPVTLTEPIKYPEGVEDFTENPPAQETSVRPVVAPIKSTQEAVKLTFIKSPVKTDPLGQFKPTAEPVNYDAESQSDSAMESVEHIHLGNNKAAKMDTEQSQDESPVGTIIAPAAESGHFPVKSKHFGEPVPNINESFTEPSGLVITEETQLDTAQTRIDDVSSPIKPGHSDLESVLFPEEPLTSLIESETALLEMAKCPEQDMRSSLVQVKCANDGEELTTALVWDITGTPEDLLASPEKSDNTICEAADMAVSPLVQPSENTELYATESIKNSAISATLPTEQQNDKLDSPELSETGRSPLKSSVVQEFTMVVDPLDQVRNMSANIDTDIQHSPTSEVLHKPTAPVPLPAEESLEPIQKTTDIVEETMTILVQATQPSTEAREDSAGNINVSQESVVPPAEPSSLPHTFSQNRNSAQTLSAEQCCEANNSSDMLLYPPTTGDPWAIPQDLEKEPWVLVQRDELADFKECTEDRPLRPASLSQDGEVQEEQTKAEEEGGERASVCSTLSDPQLAGQSSSETSTPEELKTYEDTSSGVESHSDDVATSPQTTLTSDPDLGIHMGQEEGADTPAGTPASKSKGVPHPLQNPGIEGQAEETSPSAIRDSSENDQMVRKKEGTGVSCSLTSAVSREQKYEEGAEERGAQRVFPAPFSR
ncbi:proline-rich protein 36 isoform X2 [Pseudophryne corroboree]|uniref:proline-rich protein 36 isoform X2 n=1 Tax=Pseudophryne corroboree TaxID=495146 RepID=UPI00308120C4